MSNISLSGDWVRNWISDHDPSTSEITNGGSIELYNPLFNTVNGKVFICTYIDSDNPNLNLEWKQLGTFTQGAHIADCATDAPTNLNVITTLLGTLTSQVNSTNAKQNDIATKLNLVLDRLEGLGLLAAS